MTLNRLTLGSLKRPADELTEGDASKRARTETSEAAASGAASHTAPTYPSTAHATFTDATKTQDALGPTTSDCATIAAATVPCPSSTHACPAEEVSLGAAHNSAQSLVEPSADTPAERRGSAR